MSSIVSFDGYLKICCGVRPKTNPAQTRGFLSSRFLFFKVLANGRIAEAAWTHAKRKQLTCRPFSGQFFIAALCFCDIPSGFDT
jgi:hypothetical protein